MRGKTLTAILLTGWAALNSLGLPPSNTSKEKIKSEYTISEPSQERTSPFLSQLEGILDNSIGPKRSEAASEAWGMTPLQNALIEAKKYANDGEYQKTVDLLNPFYQNCCVVKKGTGGWDAKDMKVINDLKTTLAWGYTRIGDILLNKKDYSKAEKNYNKALSIFSDFALAYDGIAAIRGNNKQLKEALKYALKAVENYETIKHLPHASDVYRSLGRIYGKLAIEAKKKNDFRNAKKYYSLNAKAYEDYLKFDPKGRFSKQCKRSIKTLNKKYINNPNFS